MATVKERGFTIIELMLFLGISGALFAALMIGVNGTIAQQRYKESVQSYAALVQAQYADATNPQNDRTDTDWTCDGGMVEIPGQGTNAAAVPRGNSGCVILGKALQVIKSGTQVKTSWVVGYNATGTDPSESDIASIQKYDPKVAAGFDEQIHDVDWGSRLVSAANEQPSTATVLILRSPVSGLLRVFVRPEAVPATLNDMITSSTAVARLTNCIEGDGVNGPIASVTVNAAIASSSGVTIDQGNREGACA